MKAVVGLGNPGLRYANTRHNVGFWVVDCLADDQPPWQQMPSYLYHAVHSELVLIKPTTYMNDSGVAVFDVVRQFDLVLHDVLVIVDDIHLDVGRLRFRRHGSHGGHNGLRSIVEVLGSSDFPRLRVGVGQPLDSDDLIGHVLGQFLPAEQEFIRAALIQAAEGVLCWASSGVDAAMNHYNAL